MMSRCRMLLIACMGMGIVSMSGCASVSPSASVTGTATYRERMALPPDAVLQVRLEDVSRADAPAVVIGQTTVQPAGQVPIRFAVSYDPARIQSGHRYHVRASILVGDKLWFVTDMAYPVLNEQETRHVDILLKRVAQVAPTATLENTYWKFLTLHGKPLVVADSQREPHLLLHPADKRVSGSGGCNGLVGSYQLDGGSLTFSHMAGTLMACLHGMEQEHQIHVMLPSVRHWKVEGERLKLLNEQNEVLAELESRYLR